MKIEDLVYIVAGEALTLLEKKYHYRVAEDHKRDIQNTIQKNLNQYIKQATSGEKPQE